MSGIDTKIEPLVKFLNQLDGVITIGSCQGHDDGAGSGEWVYPYIKFKCTNNQTLGFLASIEDAYKSIKISFNNIYSSNDYSCKSKYKTIKLCSAS